MRFDRLAHLEAWEHSPRRAELLRQAEPLLLDDAPVPKARGMELWFTLPDTTAFRPKPACYKTVVVGTIAVYPLLLLINTLLGPLLQPLPNWLGLLVSVALLSALLAYPVMPWLTRLLDPWLYPAASGPPE